MILRLHLLNPVCRKAVILLWILLSVSIQKNYAQQKDTLDLYRDFMRVCSEYKKVPLYAKIEIHTILNSGLVKPDSMVSDAEFYLQSKGTYLRMGELEQIMNDSFMLIISKKHNRIMIYPNKKTVNEQVKMFNFLQLEDSSLLKLSRKYSASVQDEMNNEIKILLTGREKISGTTLSKENLQISYDKKKLVPNEIIQVKRSLSGIDSAEYHKLSGEPLYTERLVKLEKNNIKKYFLIGNQQTRYHYKKLDYSTDIEMPLKMEDCVARNAQGLFVPIKSYVNYVISK